MVQEVIPSAFLNFLILSTDKEPLASWSQSISPAGRLDYTGSIIAHEHQGPVLLVSWHQGKTVPIT